MTWPRYEINLFDTVRCPKASSCFQCGSVHNLKVVTFRAEAGVVCETVCHKCDWESPAFTRTGKAGVISAAAHELHLRDRWPGFDQDEEAAILLWLDGQDEIRHMTSEEI